MMKIVNRLGRVSGLVRLRWGGHYSKEPNKNLLMRPSFDWMR